MDELLAGLRDSTRALSALQAKDRAAPAPAAATAKQQAVHELMLDVERHFGIHPSPQVENKLNRAFQAMPDHVLREWLDYLRGQPGDHPEWVSLVESLTVHETYFGRDKPMLDMMTESVFQHVLERKKDSRRLTIWSAGCSTGEEVYSICMLLLETLLAAGLAGESGNGEIMLDPAWNIDILGTDISGQVIRVANAGTYAHFNMGSFRSLPRQHWRFFESMEVASASEHYRVKNFVRRHVRFQRHNLMSRQAPGMGIDLVMCRNVMIYFNDEKKAQAQALLTEALRPEGVLMLGGTDVLLYPDRYQRNFGKGGAWYVKKST